MVHVASGSGLRKKPKQVQVNDAPVDEQDSGQSYKEVHVGEKLKQKKLRIAFVHPDLGIGGAERLVVDAALGLQRLGHHVTIYTSYHDKSHCFEETRDGTLEVYGVHPPFFLPRSFMGRFHALLAHLRQLHLTFTLLNSFFLASIGIAVKKLGFIPFLAPVPEDGFDVYFVDQLSTCIPLLRWIAGTRVLFYCHFPDKLLAEGEYVDSEEGQKTKNFSIKSLYRMPLDFAEETTTGQADVVLANSNFTARVFKKHFKLISSSRRIQIVYPGINVDKYERMEEVDGEDVEVLKSEKKTFVSMNRFEKKKNIGLAVEAFSLLLQQGAKGSPMRLVLAGGYDPRVHDNINTLATLLTLCTAQKLSFYILNPPPKPHPHPENTAKPEDADVLFVLNFSTAQRTYLLTFPLTLGLLYTPANEHFGIGPVEGMACGVPVVACNSGGPKESILSPEEGEEDEYDSRTGWLVSPDASSFANAMSSVLSLSPSDRSALSVRSKERARTMFGMDVMAMRLEEELRRTYAMGPVWGDGTFVLMLFAVGLGIGVVLGR